MTEQTAAPFGGFDPDLSAELSALNAREAEIEAAIKPLQDELRRVRETRSTIWDLQGELAETDAELMAMWPRSGPAYEKVGERVRALHPYLYNILAWSPRGYDPHRSYIGAHLALTSYGAKSLDPGQAESLAEALVEFARRFVAEIPDEGEHPGMIFADILDRDCSATRSYHLMYAPDGSEAVLINARWGSGSEVARGSLAEVCRVAIVKAAEPSPDDEDDDY